MEATEKALQGGADDRRKLAGQDLHRFQCLTDAAVFFCNILGLEQVVGPSIMDLGLGTSSDREKRPEIEKNSRKAVIYEKYDRKRCFWRL